MMRRLRGVGMRVVVNKDVQIETVQVTPDRKIEIRRNQYRKKFASLEALDRYYRNKEDEQRETKYF